MNKKHQIFLRYEEKESITENIFEIIEDSFINIESQSEFCF